MAVCALALAGQVRSGLGSIQLSEGASCRQTDLSWLCSLRHETRQGVASPRAASYEVTLTRTWGLWKVSEPSRAARRSAHLPNLPHYLITERETFASPVGSRLQRDFSERFSVELGHWPRHFLRLSARGFRSSWFRVHPPPPPLQTRLASTCSLAAPPEWLSTTTSALSSVCGGYP